MMCVCLEARRGQGIPGGCVNLGAVRQAKVLGSWLTTTDLFLQMETRWYQRAQSLGYSQTPLGISEQRAFGVLTF